MESKEIKNMTNEQIIAKQKAIQDSLIFTSPILKDLQEKINRLKLTTYQQQSDYRELDRELYLRTNDITKLVIPAKKKRTIKSDTQKSEAQKTIDKLVKELGNDEIKRLIEKLNQSKKATNQGETK